MSYRNFAYRPLSMLALACFSLCAIPATAQDFAQARLVSCEEGSCLRVQGFRDNPAIIVMLNGHKVHVEGQRSWKCTIPLDTVRAIAGQGDRNIEVSYIDPASQQEVTTNARLPIGLLGDTTGLSLLVVKAP